MLNRNHPFQLSLWNSRRYLITTFRFCMVDKCSISDENPFERADSIHLNHSSITTDVCWEESSVDLVLQYARKYRTHIRITRLQRWCLTHGCCISSKKQHIHRLTKEKNAWLTYKYSWTLNMTSSCWNITQFNRTQPVCHTHHPLQCYTPPKLSSSHRLPNATNCAGCVRELLGKMQLNVWNSTLYVSRKIEIITHHHDSL